MKKTIIFTALSSILLSSCSGGGEKPTEGSTTIPNAGYLRIRNEIDINDDNAAVGITAAKRLELGISDIDSISPTTRTSTRGLFGGIGIWSSHTNQSGDLTDGRELTLENYRVRPLSNGAAYSSDLLGVEVLDSREYTDSGRNIFSDLVEADVLADDGANIQLCERYMITQLIDPWSPLPVTWPGWIGACDTDLITGGASISDTNKDRRNKRINALHWQTHIAAANLDQSALYPDLTPFPNDGGYNSGKGAFNPYHFSYNNSGSGFGTDDRGGAAPKLFEALTLSEGEYEIEAVFSTNVTYDEKGGVDNTGDGLTTNEKTRYRSFRIKRTITIKKGEFALDFYDNDAWLELELIGQKGSIPEADIINN